MPNQSSLSQQKAAKPKQQKTLDQSSAKSSANLKQSIDNFKNFESQSPDDVLHIQQTLGNQFLLQQMANDNKKAIQRFQTKDEWVTDSELDGTLWGTKKRSTALKAVDKAVGDYEAYHNSDNYEERRDTMWAIAYAIDAWRKSKGDEGYEAEQPSIHTNRWAKIKELKDAITVEDRAIQQLINAREDEKRRIAKEEQDRKIAAFVPDEVKNLEDNNAKATRIFNLYMERFRGTASYTLSTDPGASMYNDEGTIACATISAGLRDAFRYAGLTSSVIKIPHEKFITKPITDAFMDTGAVGNVKRPDGSYSDEKRFFFTEHYIVKVNGTQHFDPTSGVVVSADGGEIIDPKYMDLVDSDVQYQYKKGDNLTLDALIGDAPSGSGYVLTET